MTREEMIAAFQSHETMPPAEEMFENLKVVFEHYFQQVHEESGQCPVCGTRSAGIK